MTGNEIVSDETIQPAAADGECEVCGRRGLLARITSRTHHSSVHICDECLDQYRRGDPEVAKMVMGRLRPL